MKFKTVLLSLLLIGSAFVAISTMSQNTKALYYFWDDFDNAPMSGWTTTGQWHFYDDGMTGGIMDPCVGAPGHPLFSYDFPGSFGYHDDVSCDYDTGAANTGELVSPVMDLTGPGVVWLHFYTWFQTELNNQLVDTLMVDVFDGISWTNEYQIEDTSHSMVTWLRIDIDLSAYAGLTNVRVRFVFDTVNAVSNTWAGWYIDDVLVDDVAAVPIAMSLPYVEDFDPGPGPFWSWTSHWHPTNEVTDACMQEGDGVTSYVSHPKSNFNSPGSMGFHVDAPNPGGPDCTYDDGQRSKGWLESPAIDLATGPPIGAHLSFWFWAEFEVGWEVLEVQISTDRENYTVLDDLTTYFMGAGSYRMGMWNFYSANISAYIGNGTVWIRFYFDSLDSWFNGYSGWYIDEFVVDEIPTIQSQFIGTDTPPTIDGVFDASEWMMNGMLPGGADNWEDLTMVPNNALGGNYLIVMNDIRGLYIMYDAIGDMTMDAPAVPTDGSQISFDPLNDDLMGAGGDLDDEWGTDGYYIMGGGYHYSNSVFADACVGPPQCAMGWGTSPNSGVPHRIYEYSIPFTSLGFGTTAGLPWPLTLGYTMGFAASSGPSGTNPGVYDLSADAYDQWPIHPMPPAILTIPEYGDLIIAVPQVLANNYPIRESAPEPPPVPPPYVLDEYDLYQYETNSWDHAVLGMRQTTFGLGDDYFLVSTPNITFASPVEFSNAPPDTVEVVVINKSTYPTPPNIGGGVPYTAGIQLDDYIIEMENDFDDHLATDNWRGMIESKPEGLEVLDAYEVSVSAPGNYEFRLGMDPNLDLDFLLFDVTAPSPTEAGRVGTNPPLATSENDGAGVQESIGPVALTTGIDYVLVVTNENFSSAGPYVISPPETLDVTWTNQAPTSIEQWNVSVEMLAINLVSSGTTTIDGITLYLNGTASDFDVSAVTIYDDVNNNQAFDPDIDMLMARNMFAAGISPMTFNNPYVVNSGTPENLLVMVNVAPSATLGNTIGINISSPADFLMIDPDTVNMPSIPESNLTTINAGTIPMITSQWQAGAPMPDGSYAPGEHIVMPGTNAFKLNAIAGNAIPAWLIVENNDTYLYVTYDVIGDVTNDFFDGSSFGLDTDNDDLVTDGADDEFDLSPGHYVYDAGFMWWMWEDACDPTFDPQHNGLACSMGFGISDNSPIPHRIFEYRIPLVLIEASPIPATPIGFTGASNAGGAGIYDPSNPFFTDFWPQVYFIAPPMSEYGDLLLTGPPDPVPLVEAWEPGGTFGQSYPVGASVNVLWNASDENPWPNAGNVVNISYGVPGSWTPIVNNELEDGSYMWDTTGVSPGAYYINISVYDDGSQETWDIGNNTFNIFIGDPQPSIEAWEPGGSAGQSYIAGQIVTVLWNATDNNPWPNLDMVVNISYGMPGSWTSIVNDELEDGSYLWDTTSVPLGTYYINVSVYDDTGQESWDLGNETFDIVGGDPTPFVEAWEPGGSAGQSYTVGQFVDVIWTATDNNPWPNANNVVNISYGTPGSWTSIVNVELEDGLYSWDTSGVLPGAYYINVSVYDDGSQESWDLGNNTFDIGAGDPPPNLAAWEPGGTAGQTYTQGNMIPVTWTASDTSPWPNSDNVVNISYGSPGSWTTIVNNEQEDGSYLWDTTSVPCSFDYRMNITVYDSAGQEVYDLGNNTFNLSCPPPPGSIIGTVEDENGDAIKDANIKLYDLNGDLVNTTETDSDGDFSLEDVPPGDDYYIEISVDGYDDETVENIDITSGVEEDLGTITLTTDGKISGKVVDENGDPIDDATVKLYDSNDDLIDTFTTGSNGEYEFEDLGYGSYYVKISASGYQDGTTDQYSLDKNNLDIAVPDTTLPAEAAGGIADWWWIILIVIIIVIVLIIALLLMRKKKRPEPWKEPEPKLVMPEEAAAPPPPAEMPPEPQPTPIPEGPPAQPPPPPPPPPPSE